MTRLGDVRSPDATPHTEPGPAPGYDEYEPWKSNSGFATASPYPSLPFRSVPFPSLPYPPLPFPSLPFVLDPLLGGLRIDYFSPLVLLATQHPLPRPLRCEAQKEGSSKTRDGEKAVGPKRRIPIFPRPRLLTRPRKNCVGLRTPGRRFAGFSWVLSELVRQVYGGVGIQCGTRLTDAGDFCFFLQEGCRILNSCPE